MQPFIKSGIGAQTGKIWDLRVTDYIFILFLSIGALGIQFVNEYLSKNRFNPTNFLMLVPLILIAQYFIGWGYPDGTAQTNFISANVVWVGILIIATLAINYALFERPESEQPLSSGFC